MDAVAVCTQYFQYIAASRSVATLEQMDIFSWENFNIHMKSTTNG